MDKNTEGATLPTNNTDASPFDNVFGEMNLDEILTTEKPFAFRGPEEGESEAEYYAALRASISADLYAEWQEEVFGREADAALRRLMARDSDADVVTLGENLSGEEGVALPDSTALVANIVEEMVVPNRAARRAQQKAHRSATRRAYRAAVRELKLVQS